MYASKHHRGVFRFNKVFCHSAKAGISFEIILTYIEIKITSTLNTFVLTQIHPQKNQIDTQHKHTELLLK